MKRERSKRIAVVLAFVLAVTLCGPYQLHTLGRKTENLSASKNADGISAVLDKNESGLPDTFETWCEQILNGCNSKNTYGYPLDESFVLWFYQNYGSHITSLLASQIKASDGEDLWYPLTGNTLHVLWLYYCRDTGLHADTMEQTYFKDSENSTDIVMNFAGDVNFDEDWPSMKAAIERNQGITDSFTNGLLEQMQSADIMMLNNECTYGTGGTPLVGKAYTFQADPKYASILRKMGVDLVSLANNHVYDYGATGLRKTLNALQAIKMPNIGAGTNLEHAERIAYFVINGRKIAIASATQIERTLNFTKEATDASPGVLKTLNPDKFLKVIQEAKENADYVIAFVHWGTEDRNKYEADQTSLGHQYIDAGADAVIGGHTHCLQGIEFYKEKPIYYSLGNFWFDWDVKGADKTGLAQITLHEDGSATYQFIPCQYQNKKTRLLTSSKKKNVYYRYLESLSDHVKIDKNGVITPEK